jgi:hypothetical protein
MPNLLGLPFDTEAGGNTFIRKVRKLLPDYTASHPDDKYPYTSIHTLAIAVRLSVGAASTKGVDIPGKPKLLLTFLIIS